MRTLPKSVRETARVGLPRAGAHISFLKRATNRLSLLAISLLIMAPGSSGVRAGDDLVKSFASGSGIGSVGTSVSEYSDDKEEDGPQALNSGDDGKIYVLDQINGRVLSFDPSDPGAPPRSFELPHDLQPTDLVARGDTIFVWDGNIHALEATGPRNGLETTLTETRSGEPVDDFTRSAFAQMGSQVADEASGRGLPASRSPGHSRQFVATRGKGAVIVDVTLAAHDASAVLEVRSKDSQKPFVRLQIAVPDRLGSIAFLEIDKTGRMFVLAENIPSNLLDRASAFVVRYSPAGAIEGVYELPLSRSMALSRRFVTISPDGNVYFLRSQRNSADIIGLGFRPTPNAKFVSTGGERRNNERPALTNRNGMNMAVGPLTRQRIIQTAYDFEGVRWHLSPSNYGPERDQLCTGFEGRIRRPLYLIGRLGQDVRSVPYCWGCEGSLGEFVSRMQRGALAGNVCTRDNVRADVAGVDCSSFVCAAWGLSTHFTTSVIPSIARPLTNPWDLLPGDALDKPGSHVVLFLGFTPDRMVEVMEASPGACRGRVCRNIYPLASLLEYGFIPLRYRALLSQ